MAALPEAPRLEIVDLTQVTAQQLAPLFQQELETWRRRFRWDFRASVDLLTRYIKMQSLYGYALKAGNRIAGYTYFVCEGRKGLIGDFFVTEEFGEPEYEGSLLNAAVSGLMRTSGVRRIECQLMLLRSPDQLSPFRQYLSRHERLYMEIDARSIDALIEQRPEIEVTFVPWAERHGEEIAHLVSSSYKGHVDSKINDQYRSIPGARHFLTNIIRYPGCGVFSPASSVVAIDRRTGRICGVCLTSHVSERAGHVTQLCILPAIRGARLGYELIRRGLQLLVKSGCQTISLTVTCSNTHAIRLYQSLGFSIQCSFPAMVWEGF